MDRGDVLDTQSLKPVVQLILSYGDPPPAVVAVVLDLEAQPQPLF
mgnify:CR=1 FL=1